MAMRGNAAARDTGPKPPVNGHWMNQYIGRHCRCLLKVVEVGPAGVICETSDQIKVTVLYKSAEAYSSLYVEVTGLVEKPNILRELSVATLGDKADMSIYNKMVELVNGEESSFFLK